MNQIILRSKPLTSLVVNHMDAKQEAINSPWCAVLYTKYNEIWTYGYNTKEQAEHDILERLYINETDGGGWSLYGLYHHKKPIDINVTINFLDE